jgi:glycosyltransferase involved in cell wall biosynthesis
VPLAPAIDTSIPSNLDVTVILSTYNRCADLAGALESIAQSEMPDSVSWEVLVVDNNSTDQTRNVVKAVGDRYPKRFRYLFESKPGKSYALNAAIAGARGNVLAFVDDDVTVASTWLRRLTAELSGGGEWVGVGGRILPAEKFTPPPWLPTTGINNWITVVFPYFDQGDRPVELSCPPYGTNMAFRKSVFEKHGGFRIDLGPSPHSQIRNEDTELGRRLLAAGERLRYEPSAVVYHPVPNGRVTQEYFFSYWFDYGRAMIIERGDRPNLFGIPRDYLALVRRGAEIPVMALRSMLAIHPRERFRHKCLICKSKGQIVELYRRLNSTEAKRRLQAT